MGELPSSGSGSRITFIDSRIANHGAVAASASLRVSATREGNGGCEREKRLRSASLRLFRRKF
jgi:hypothetical protein